MKPKKAGVHLTGLIVASSPLIAHLIKFWLESVGVQTLLVNSHMKSIHRAPRLNSFCETHSGGQGRDNLYKKSFVVISTYAIIATGGNGLQRYID